MVTVMQRKQLEAAASFVSDRLKNEPTGHDAAHVARVRQLAVRIANQEGGSLLSSKWRRLYMMSLMKSCQVNGRLRRSSLRTSSFCGNWTRGISAISWTLLQRCLFVIGISSLDQ